MRSGADSDRTRHSGHWHLPATLSSTQAARGGSAGHPIRTESVALARPFTVSQIVTRKVSVAWPTRVLQAYDSDLVQRGSKKHSGQRDGDVETVTERSESEIHRRSCGPWLPYGLKSASNRWNSELSQVGPEPSEPAIPSQCRQQPDVVMLVDGGIGSDRDGRCGSGQLRLHQVRIRDR